MKTLLLWTMTFTTLVGAALGQSGNAGRTFSQKDTTGHFKPPVVTIGWNVVSSGGGATQVSESIIDAAQFVAIGGDVCTQINQALKALPSTGGTVDARGLIGTALNCVSNPWNTVSQPATLLLGAATYETTATWLIPNKSRMFGIGRGDPNSL